MTINIIAKHKDGKPITTDDTVDLMTFCDTTFGMKNDEEYWFQHFAHDRNAIYGMAEDVDENLDIELFDKYAQKYPGMKIYVEYVM